jgi:CheY-like chemotaxis protein
VSTRPFTLLYVEDNPVNQTLMRLVIAERNGVKLELAADGVAGVEAAHALHPDLVLLDLNLPRLDGYGVLARLRADPALALIPCVAVSANAMPTEVRRALDAGFADYLTKPFEVDNVLALVDRLRG